MKTYIIGPLKNMNAGEMSTVVTQLFRESMNTAPLPGAGGFRFGDYWRVGVALEILVVALSILLLPLLFPFRAP